MKRHYEVDINYRTMGMVCISTNPSASVHQYSPIEHYGNTYIFMLYGMMFVLELLFSSPNKQRFHSINRKHQSKDNICIHYFFPTSHLLRGSHISQA